MNLISSDERDHLQGQEVMDGPLFYDEIYPIDRLLSEYL